VAPQTTNCNGFACYTDPADNMAKCRTDCSTDPECATKYYCQSGADGGTGSQCPSAFPLGTACTRNAQCLSGTCSDGVCCNVNCDKCGSCNSAGSLGTCIPIPAGTDPENECMDSASDPTGMCKGFCSGRAGGGCTYPAVGTGCGTCKTCNGSGLCSVMPEDDPTCGDIDCDELDTACMDYRDLRTRRCAALGMCKTATVAHCTDVTNTCGADGGAGGSGGGNDGGNDAGQMGGGGGGGCCAVAGPQPPALPSLLLVAFVWFVRRRRR
jgi:MYXO-CTERM domain-containing protein